MKGSITITNHTDCSIEVRTTKPDSADVNKHVVAPKEYHVFFADSIDSLHWVKTDLLEGAANG